MQLTQSIILVLVASSSAEDRLPDVFYKNFSRVVVSGSANAGSVGKLDAGQGEIYENGTQLVKSRLGSVASFGKSLQFVSKARLDINQKVYIEGQPTLGDGAGQGALNKCRNFASQHVSSPDKPNIKVCGTGIKLTAYLMGACKKYYSHSRIIGKCQSSMPPSTCDSFSPAQDARFGAYQSYKIEPC